MTVCLPQRVARGRMAAAAPALRSGLSRLAGLTRAPGLSRVAGLTWVAGLSRVPDLTRAPGSSGAIRPVGWWWPAALYPAGLAVAAVVQAAVPPQLAGRLVDWASTDLDNLARNPVGSMLASAFVVGDDLPAWMLLGLVGLGTLGRRFGAVRAVLLATAAHVVGTLVSQGVTAWRLQAGLAEQAERFALDVGPSYLVVGALAAGLVAGTGRTRWLCGIGLAVLAPFLFEGLTGLEVAAVGHLVAIVVGLAGAVAVTLVDRARAAGRAFAGDPADVGR